MTEHCHHTVITDWYDEDACGEPAVTTRQDDERGHHYPVCREHCPHLATVTAPLHVVHGDRVWVQAEATRCVTCDETLTLPEPEEPARD